MQNLLINAWDAELFNPDYYGSEYSADEFCPELDNISYSDLMELYDEFVSYKEQKGQI